MSNRAISVFLFGELDAANTKEIVSLIVNCNRALEDKPPYIELYINSQGGPVYYAMAIINCMKESLVPIHTICLGNASSAAAHIFAQGCKGKREMKRDATLMFHSSHIGYDVTSIHVMEAERHHNIFIEDWFDFQLFDNASFSDFESMKKEFSTPIPRYVAADEAIKLGMCDIKG